MATISLEELRSRHGDTPAKRVVTLDELKSVGAKPVQPTEDVQKPEPTFFSRVKESISERFGKSKEAIARSQAGQDPLSSGLQIAGQIAGGAIDIAGAGVIETLDLLSSDKAVADLQAKSGKLGSRILQTPIGKTGMEALQSGVESWEKFKEESPTAAANIEAVVNLAEFIPVGRVTKRVTGQAVDIATPERGVVGEVGEAITEQAEGVIQEKRKGFIDELIRPLTKKSKEETERASFFAGSKEGKLTTREFELTKPQKEVAEEVAKIEGVTSGKTARQNGVAVAQELTRESTELVSKLKAKNVAVTPSQVESALDVAKQSIDDTIKGDVNKEATNLIEDFVRIFNKVGDDGKRLYAEDVAGLYEARIAYDQWVKTQKGAGIFKPENVSALKSANRSIRTSVNEMIDRLAGEDVKFLDSMKKQTNLYSAIDDVIAPKAAKESNNALARMLDKVAPLVGGRNTLLQIGLAGAGTAVFKFAPFVLQAGLGVGAGVQAVRMVISPKSRKALGALLVKMEQIQKTAGTAEKETLIQAAQEIKQLLEEAEDEELSGQNESK